MLRRIRRKKIKQIAKLLNWEFCPQRKLSELGFPTRGNVLDVLQGSFSQREAFIFDATGHTAYDIYEEYEIFSGHFTSVRPSTKLVILYKNCKFPQMTLRPPMWGDHFSTSTVNARQFTVYGESIDMLNSIFTPETIIHYEQTQKFYITVKNDKVILHFYDEKHLEPTKERYLDLISEGKYFHHLLAPLFCK